MWVLAQELTGHALFSIASLREDFASLVRRHVGAFRPDPEAIAEKLSSLDSDERRDPMQAMQQVLGDPAVLLGAVQSPEQRELQPSLDAAAAAVDRLRRLHGRRRVAFGSSAATRCGLPKPSAAAGSSTTPTTCTSSDCSACA